jgi:hypothetical protein
MTTTALPKPRKTKAAPAAGLRLKLDAKTAAVTIADAATNDGWHGLQFYISTESGQLTASSVKSQKTSAGKKTWVSELAPGIAVSIESGPSPTGEGIWLKPSITNRTADPFYFSGYGFQVADGATGPTLNYHGLTVFAHSENLRYENLPHSREAFPFVRPLPESHRIYGQQGLGPMPVMIIGRVTKDRWLVEGAASQDRHAPSWHLDLSTAPGRMMEYKSEYFWIGGSPEEVPAGQTVALESTVYLLADCTPDRFYDAYVDELVELYGDRFAGPHSRLALEPVYCSWNFGIYTHINEKDCLKRIAIAGKTQKGGIFQLDHGFQPPHKPHLSWGHMDAYYPDTSATWDPARFPGGPRKIVDACRKAGLTPALWWTPRMDVGGPIATDHPEWIAVNKDGNPIENVGDLHPDYSVPEVREFIMKTLRLVIHEWGFEGIKLDFFSWAFDAPDVVYRNGGTNVFWKRWLLRFVREELGKNGYFLHCVSCPLGNPFLAIDGCDSFRAGGDIDHGGWENNVYNCSWFLGSFPASGKRTWFVDMDSFMGDMKYPGNERRFRSAFGYLTSGMIDISGPTETFDAAAMREYRLLSERCDQGGPVQVLDRTAFFGRALPRVLARLHETRSKTRKQFGVLATVGLFNWDNAPQTVGVALSQLGLKLGAVQLRDFWTGKDVELETDVVSIKLEPRQHLILDIRAR